MNIRRPLSQKQVGRLFESGANLFHSNLFLFVQLARSRRSAQVDQNFLALMNWLVEADVPSDLSKTLRSDVFHVQIRLSEHLRKSRETSKRPNAPSSELIESADLLVHGVSEFYDVWFDETSLSD